MDNTNTALHKYNSKKEKENLRTLYYKNVMIPASHCLRAFNTLKSYEGLRVKLCVDERARMMMLDYA